jgi:hypothetical protein
MSPQPGAVDLAGLRDRLVAGVADAVEGLAAGDGVEVTGRLLRRGRTCPESVGRSEPAFRWQPSFVRRSLGLAAVRACADGRFRGPAAAVAPVADQAVEAWRHSGRRTFHWEPWYCGLGPGARAVVLAEAVTWATPLWAAAEWTALGARAVIGGVDDRWVCPGSRTVLLKGRCDAHVAPPAGGPPGDGRAAAGRGAIVSVIAGGPGDDWVGELAYPALVAGLGRPGRPLPLRAVGLWPQSGDRRTVGIDQGSLTSAVDRVVATVGLVASARCELSVTAPV